MSATTESVQQQIAQLLKEAQSAAVAAADVVAIEDIRVRYLGKKGLLTEQLKRVGTLPPEERPNVGKWVNEAKDALTESLQVRKQALESSAQDAQLERERLDITLPGRGVPSGGLHPITRTLERLER